MKKKSIYKTADGKKKVQDIYASFLSQWNNIFQQYELQTSLGHTFLMDNKRLDTETVILLHGSGSNSAMWQEEAAHLSKAFRVIAIDIPGECGKSAETRMPFKKEMYAGWMHEIMEQLQLHKTSFVACSLGAWIALSFAITYPLKVHRISLLAPAGLVPVKLKSIFWIIITSFTGAYGFRKLNKMVYGALDIAPEAIAFSHLIREHFVPRTDTLPIIENMDLQKIKVPVQYIGGDRDCFYATQKAAIRLKHQLQDTEIHILKDTGHVLINQGNKIGRFLQNSQ